MSTAASEQVEAGGWRFLLTPEASRFSSEQRRRLIEIAYGAAAGSGVGPIRRSRHAASYRAELSAGGSPETDVFIKVLDPPHGAGALKRWFRPSHVAHLVAITAALNRDGFETPPILLFGREAATRREIIATVRARGTLLPRNFAVRPEMLARKRAMLRELGATVARMHRVGYIHGDLTPYNVFVANDADPHFIFIDHERTRRTFLSHLERPRMRNLVQLGRFELRGLSRTDRMRVLHGYAGAMRARKLRALRRRVARLLASRMERDYASAERIKAATVAVVK
ncbi:MAG TPA: lipopolysaccharide kinase InaA family protein [Candidatus Binataceae bacterium]